VLYAFGVTGNGSKEFFYQLEETVVDSPIPIETPFLEKILAAYAQVDLGTPPLYSTIVEKVLGRGLDKMSVESIVEMAKNLKRSTNV
jgi:hypothetical protein